MGEASFNQSSFLGGAWSKTSQGRVDDPRYKSALALSQNHIPMEEGALIRRPGLLYTNTTRSGVAGRLIPYNSAESTSYTMEFTTGHLRVLNGIDGVVFRNDQVSVTSISNATPAVATIASDKGWVTGDQVEFFIDSILHAGQYPSDYNLLRYRKFTVTRLTGTTYSIADAITGASIVGTDVNTPAATVALVAYSVYDVATPWTGTTWSTLRSVQNQSYTVLLHSTTAPRTFTLSATGNVGTGTLATANLTDGPYLDPDIAGTLLCPVWPNAAQPNIVDMYCIFPFYDATYAYGVGQLSGEFAVGYRSLVDNNINHEPQFNIGTYWEVVPLSICNGTNGFAAGDIGRCVRFKSEPPAWLIGTTYDTGDAVLYAGQYYLSLVDTNLGIQPDTDTTKWVPTNGAAVATWTWGRIISVSATNPFFRLEILGPQILYCDTTPQYYIISITQFRLGLFGGGSGNGYPTCGVFHQGRLWLGGAAANRFDASNSNDFFNFAPANYDGTVADNHSIAAVLNADEINSVFWMKSIHEGIMVGSIGGEWLIQASKLNDPITPTNIQANKATKYGCKNALPVETGLSLVFIQKLGRKLLEMLPGVFSSQYSAPNISLKARNLVEAGVSEIAYHEEPIPIIWARKADGTLSGITYRRTSAFVTDEPNISAWFDVALGSDFTVESICTTPNYSVYDTTGTACLAAVIYSASTGLRYTVFMREPIPENGTTYNAMFLDNARAPYGMLVTTSGGVSGLRAYGLWHLNGKTVTAFIGGLDCGDVAVSGGSAFIPFGGDADGLFTLANMQAISGSSYGKLSATFSAGSGATVYTIPAAFGFTYTSIGQTLRPGSKEDAGTPNGPPLGKTRRSHMFTAQFLNTVSAAVNIGTVATKVRPIKFKTAGGTAYNRKTLFTGVVQDTLEDDYSFDSMLYWTITRPYPVTILQVGANLHTQDR